MGVNESQWKSMGVSMAFLGYLKDVSGHFDRVSRVCHVVFRVFPQNFQSVSKVFPGCLKGVLRVLQVCFNEFKGV